MPYALAALARHRTGKTARDVCERLRNLRGKLSPIFRFMR